MTKDVLVSVSGLHFDAMSGGTGENDAIEVVVPGMYYCKNGKHYILYDVIEDDGDGVTKNKIKIDGNDIVEIRKSGMVQSHMIFEKNKRHLTGYQTPFGRIAVGIQTRNMEVKVEEDCIDVLLDYILDVEEETLAESRVKMFIISAADQRRTLHLLQSP